MLYTEVIKPYIETRANPQQNPAPSSIGDSKTKPTKEEQAKDKGNDKSKKRKEREKAEERGKGKKPPGSDRVDENTNTKTTDQGGPTDEPATGQWTIPKPKK